MICRPMVTRWVPPSVVFGHGQPSLVYDEPRRSRRRKQYYRRADSQISTDC